MGLNTPLYTPTMTRSQIEDRAKNLMSLNVTHMVDVPPKLTSVDKYRASLGHKVKSFQWSINVRV